MKFSISGLNLIAQAQRILRGMDPERFKNTVTPLEADPHAVQAAGLKDWTSDISDTARIPVGRHTHPDKAFNSNGERRGTER